jgi:virginiamycin B lyase
MKRAGHIGAWLAVALLGACTNSDPEIVEFPLAYPDRTPLTPPPGDPCNAPVEALHPGSTHEIGFDPDGSAIWVSGQNYDSLARLPLAGGAASFLAVPEGGGPHGLAFDGRGRLWVTLEFLGRVRAVAPDGRVLADVDVALPCARMPNGRTNTRPHGLAAGPDGAMWFTGKATGTIGRIAPDGKVTHFPLPAGGPASKPIYIHAGPDGAMWATELEGNRIARVAAYGSVTEFPIPTPNSRPIAIVPGPDGAMWFSEEAGSKIGRIDRNGHIREIAVPRRQPNLILAGLAFDRAGNLWTQQYVDQNHPEPAGVDSLVRIDKAALAAGAVARPEHFRFLPVPSRKTVMHRIAQGPGGTMWFTEMHADRLGRMTQPE